MNISSIFVGLVLVGLGLPHINGKVEGNRYISPNKEFSVAITENDWPKEKEFPGQLFVDFFFKGDEATFSTFGLSYIEWVALQKAIPDAEFRKVAPSIATEHVRKHFAPDGKFDIQDSKMLEATENPTFAFVATGFLQGKPILHWQGAIVALGDRLAILGRVTPKSAISANPISSVQQLSPSFTSWVGSLHLEKRP